MYTISLHKVNIIAPLGMYPEEHIISNHFQVDVDVCQSAADYAKGHFVDYVQLNRIIQQAFQSNESILEALAHNIVVTIQSSFPFVQKVKVSLRKMHPPMQGDIAYAQVVLEA
jgi:dihydroneopterin aldolase